jgi:hypothetical protein
MQVMEQTYLTHKITKRMMWERPQLLIKALSHYSRKISSLDKDEDVQTIASEFSKEFLKGIQNLIDEINEYLKKGDFQSVNNQLDRYRLPICLAIMSYIQDLQDFKQIVVKKLKNAAPPLNMIDEEIKTFIELKADFCKSIPNLN